MHFCRQVGYVVNTRLYGLLFYSDSDLEMETDDNHATMKESFSLVKNILSPAQYSQVPPVPSEQPLWPQYSPVQSSIA